jgi:hypothetical protein
MSAHDELAAEQAHLASARQQLTRMRERTASMDSSAAGDWVSREFLESTFALRMRQLADDPTIPLFFGRLDMVSTDEGSDETFHIGRRHISDPGGNPMVIDWRAPVSLPFYRASKVEPMGVELRRRYGFQHGKLTAFEDEDLGSGRVQDYSAILEAEIERPRVGPMRDIVATIQPEQDLIVRSELTRSVCVQGAPGTGKTAVGLHRAAYLLYAHRDQLTRQGVLVVGPNASFLRYIRDVLPALGEIDATQSTIEELVSERWPVRGEDCAAVATLKGDARLAEVLRRALWSHVQTPTEGLVVPSASVAGRGVRGRGARRLAARPRGAVRRRARDGAAVPRAPGPGEDGDLRRLPRRPGAGRGGAKPAGEGVREPGLAGRPPGPPGLAAALRPRVPRRRGRRDPRPGRAGAAALAEAAEEPGHGALVAR